RLGDALTSAQVTVRDLLCMRTGLPRHDLVWMANPMSRHELIERLGHLDISSQFRDKFQYNNLTVTAAGHVAEVVMGRSWEDLVLERILSPLGMARTSCTRPMSDDLTASYRENSRREIEKSVLLAGEVTAPSGGAIYSTVEDMARWMIFNLEGGIVRGRRLIEQSTLTELHSPQITAKTDPACPTPHA